jgi:hypothetical protein
MKWAGHEARMDEMRNAYNSSVGNKPEWKKSVRILVHRWEDNIRMDLRKTEWQGADWIHLAKDRVWRPL